MRDPFQGYDQWKTASPYDDDPDGVLEDGIAELPALCPCCGELAQWEMETIDPGPCNDLCAPEPLFTGWRCENCEWEQEAEEADYHRDASEHFKSRIVSLYERNRQAYDTAKATRIRLVRSGEWDALEHLPEGDFSWEETEAGDWHVYDCGESDCPIRWHRIAYTCDFERKDGVLTVTLNDVDEDGNWDFNDEWSDADGEPWRDSWVAVELATEGLDFFRGWAEYWLHCAQTMSDPLGEAMRGPSSMPPGEWLKFCLDAAERDIEYLEQ